MTREVLASSSPDAPSSTAAAGVDEVLGHVAHVGQGSPAATGLTSTLIPDGFDLGELQPASAREQQPPPAPPKADLGRILRAHPWRLVIAAVVVGVLASFSAWQASADHSEALNAAALRANPPVLPWLTYQGPTAGSTPDDPRGQAELTVANLGAVPVHVGALTVLNATGTSARLTASGPLTVPAHQTRSVGVELRVTCQAPHATAALEAGVVFDGRAGTALDGARADIGVSSDPDLSEELPDVIAQLCTRSTLGTDDGSIDGVIIDVESGRAHDTQATLDISNVAGASRRVTVEPAASTPFHLSRDSRGPWVLAPGAHRRVDLHITADPHACPSAEFADQWAYGTLVRIAAPPAGGSVAPQDNQSSYPLGDQLLYVLGQLAQRACG